MSLWPSLQVSKRLLRLFFCFSTPLPLLLCFKYSIFLLPFPSSLGFHAFLYHLNIGFFLLLPGNALLSLLRFLLWVLVPFPHLSVLQLDCLCNTSRQKINLPTNQRGYLRHFRDHRWKALGEENPHLSGPFLFRHYFESYVE